MKVIVRPLLFAGSAVLVLLIIISSLVAQETPDGSTSTYTSFQPEVVPFTPEMLDQLQLPEGFEVSVFAEGVGNVRMIEVAEDGTVYVSRRVDGDVIALNDRDGDGVSDEMRVVAPNIPLAHGITIHEGRFYIAADTNLYVADINDDGTLTEPQLVVGDLPGSGQHSARTIAFGPDGLFYLNIGSSCNACTESNMESATILQFQPDLSSRVIFGSGLRHTIGFDWHPETGEMWGMDHGIDTLGDDTPPEEVNQLTQDTNYGWPWCYGEQIVNNFIPGKPMDMTKEEFCAASAPPTLVYQAHSAPIGFGFYTGTQFPEAYQNDAFAVMRGSWNRSVATGYKVVRVLFEDGQPTGFEDFMTGFLAEDGATVFGRPAGIAIAPDGALLLSEDTNGIIYRIAYTGG